MTAWWGAFAMIMFFFLLFGGVQSVVRLVEGRRKFRLDQLKEQRRITEAETRERELEHKRRELEYREAMLELERFDRRTGESRGADGLPPLPDDPAVDPDGPDR